MGQTNKPGTEEDGGIFFSPLESVSLFYGLLRACSLLETDNFTGEGLEPFSWAPLKPRFIALLESLELDTFLTALSPDDDLFKEKIRIRAESDPHCFTTTFNRLFDIRKARGTFVGLRGLPWSGGTSQHKESTEEAYNRLVGVLSVLSRYEYAFQQGALPWNTYSCVALEAVLSDWAYFYSFSLVTKSSRVSAWTTQMSAEEIESSGTNHPQLAWVGQWVKEKDSFFNKLLAEFQASREQFFPIPPPGDKPDLGAQEANPAREQIERILDTLQDRLIARRQAVEKFEYYRLPDIDKNSEHLLVTLKQYGIHATNYAGALRAYEEHFADKVPPQTDEESAIEKEVQALEREVNWREVEARLVRKHPRHVEFIQHKIKQRKEDEEGRRR